MNFSQSEIDHARGVKTKPRAARFSGPVSAKKRTARVEQSFLLLWDGPTLTPEYAFHPKRKWRFDYAHVPSKVAIEIEGGIFARGRHQRPTGFAVDCDKYTEANLLGWCVIRLTDLSDVPARIADLKAAIRARTPLPADYAHCATDDCPRRARCVRGQPVVAPSATTQWAAYDPNTCTEAK